MCHRQKASSTASRRCVFHHCCLSRPRACFQCMSKKLTRFLCRHFWHCDRLATLTASSATSPAAIVRTAHHTAAIHPFRLLAHDSFNCMQTTSVTTFLRVSARVARFGPRCSTRSRCTPLSRYMPSPPTDPRPLCIRAIVPLTVSVFVFAERGARHGQGRGGCQGPHVALLCDGKRGRSGIHTRRVLFDGVGCLQTLTRVVLFCVQPNMLVVPPQVCYSLPCILPTPCKNRALHAHTLFFRWKFVIPSSWPAGLQLH